MTGCRPPEPSPTPDTRDKGRRAARDDRRSCFSGDTRLSTATLAVRVSDRGEGSRSYGLRHDPPTCGPGKGGPTSFPGSPPEGPLPTRSRSRDTVCVEWEVCQDRSPGTKKGSERR